MSNDRPFDHEVMEAEEDLQAQLPRQPGRTFDMGLGDSADHREPTYGRQRIVARVAVIDGGEQDRERVVAKLAETGVKYEGLFYTARYWTAVVYE